MSHEAPGKSNEWYTPKYIFDGLGCRFDLDVASPMDGKYCHVPADEFLTVKGLEKDWGGKFVWMNPPFGNQRHKILWLEKFFENGNGIALTPDRTSAPWWHLAASKADAIFFTKGKVKFIKPSGEKGESPSNGTCLWAKGDRAIRAFKSAQNVGMGKMFLGVDI